MPQAWALTSTRALPGSPSKEDLGIRLLGNMSLLDENVPKGMIDAWDVWSLLKEGDELRQQKNATVKELEQLGVEGYGLSAAQVKVKMMSFAVQVK